MPRPTQALFKLPLFLCLRFEWTRHEFQSWGLDLSDRFGYRVRWVPSGKDAPKPTPQALNTKAFP